MNVRECFAAMIAAMADRFLRWNETEQRWEPYVRREKPADKGVTNTQMNWLVVGVGIIAALCLIWSLIFALVIVGATHNSKQQCVPLGNSCY